MSGVFILDVTTDFAARCATLRLSHDDGRFIAAHEVDLKAHPAADWHGLFDTRRHLRSLDRVTAPAAHLAAIGRFLGEHVLGSGIARALADGLDHRTLLVRLPADPEDRLAAAFARVPWEIARAPGDERTLAGRNVVVRAMLEGTEPARETSIALGANEPVRVLLVFAEAPGQRPLAARLERERLLDLFFDDVMPTRNVEVDVLCHGVTRARIRDQVRARGGYHVVHWSGHGHVNTLQIALDAAEEAAGAAPRISGEELVGLFADASVGGFIPPVVFLSACHSGSMVSVKDWESLRASLGEGEGGGVKDGDLGLDKVLEEQPGFAGTALALVRAGVKQVVAMRYEVGDTYARRLARRVYRGMFADRAHYAADAALALGRGDLTRDARRADEYHAVDHATPLVFGSQPVRLVPASKKSAQVARRVPRPQPLLPSGSRELDAPRGFVGRGEELARLQKDWLEASKTPIALIQGLAGLGKTSLAAEAVHLWFGRFDHVLAFQAKGGTLGVEGMLQRLDHKLVLASKAYRERCQDDEMAKVYLPPSEMLKGPEREEALRNNLVDALGYERVLLVLDNFESNLLTKPRADGSYACADPAWERLFEALADRLRGTGSRVVVTSRHKPAALQHKTVWVPLGPLPTLEAALFFQGHAPLRALWYGDEEAYALAKRILYVSRGHPLILGRIADLARAHYDDVRGLSTPGRQAITNALDKIEGAGYRTLPDLFAGVRTDKDRELERRYLEDVAVGAVDLLVDRLTPDARTLLWVVTRAGEPVPEEMISSVWGSPPALLLGELCGAGLVVRDGDTYAFHELVAQRAAAWMELHPGERGGRTETEIWKAYGERYGAAFRALRGSGKREAALEAGRRAIRYLVRARAFASLGGFANAMVSSTNDPSLLGPVIADLQAAAGEVLAGQARWRLRTSVAVALDSAGRSDQAIPFFELAAEEAEAAERWSDVGTICHNWAVALGHVGQLDRARETYLKSANAHRRADNPRVVIVGSELEALRVDVEQGRAEDALPAIEEKLTEVRGWWARRDKDEPAPQAPDHEDLARTLTGGLNVATQANLTLKRWQAGLDLLDEMEKVMRNVGAGEHELARTRFNTHGPLMHLGKLAEAKAVVEDCLEIFRQAEDVTNEAMTLSALADIWDHLGDSRQAAAVEHRALALRDRLPNPGDRAISHDNLATYLDASGSPAEAGPHQLSALAYRLATGRDPSLSLRNLAIDLRQAAARGERFDLPRLADVLAMPAFTALRDFLAQHGIPPDDLQAAIDDLMEQVRAAPTDAKPD